MMYQVTYSKNSVFLTKEHENFDQMVEFCKEVVFHGFTLESIINFPQKQTA